ncbi:uncharacterized protein BT62DRAFT_934371 [Guyanagaster necrorhizus]|uniref:Uncharacterized protein n=1 Tax=Guyanagaster necrorhizus TaxID=856835 RepID=A0A9P7VP96_9AGAR|nr:uncharacterized protein BT62DRAFT_934371 [Guyanagaster necrorhizus MCA 3950]KAG7444188.1 hypothetical protein BT62DRAFT_934371 [Guyanagaster necrorhizus MCA 3950]
MIRAVPPFVLAIFSIILLGLVAFMLIVFCRVFSQWCQLRLPLRSDAGEAAPSFHVNAGWGSGQSVMQWLNFGARYIFNPPPVAELNERESAGALRLPEVVVFFRNVYTGLYHQFSTSNYPSSRILGGWLPRSRALEHINHSMA